MKNLINKFDGGLHIWLRHILLLQGLAESLILRDSYEINDIAKDLTGVIRSARADGANWIWPQNQIENPEIDDDDGGSYSLYSVDIAGMFGLDSHNDLRKFFVKEGYKKLAKDISWDTERSAWYPRFVKADTAREISRVVNAILDKKYGISQ